MLPNTTIPYQILKGVKYFQAQVSFKIKISTDSYIVYRPEEIEYTGFPSSSWGIRHAITSI